MNGRKAKKLRREVREAGVDPLSRATFVPRPITFRVRGVEGPVPGNVQSRTRANPDRRTYRQAKRAAS